MFEPRSLQELYLHLEEHWKDYKFPNQIATLFQKVRDSATESEQMDIAEKAQWEVDAFNFVLKEGQISPQFSGTYENGEPFEYPSPDLLIREMCEYLKQRHSDSKAPALVARYAQLLWCSDLKHTDYANSAIDSNFAYADFLEEKALSASDEHYDMDLVVVIKNAFFIAKAAKYKMENVTATTVRLIEKFPLPGSTPYYLRKSFAELMLSEKRYYSDADFKVAQSSCQDFANQLVQSKEYHLAIDIATLGLKLAEILQESIQPWDELIALSHESLIEPAEKQGNYAAITHCLSAISKYRTLGNLTKVSELEKRCDNLKTQLPLTEIRTPIDLTKHAEWCKKIAEELCSGDAPEILKFMALDEHVLPNYQVAVQLAGEFKQKFPLQHMAGVEMIDMRGNIAKVCSSESEIMDFHIWQQYEWLLLFDKIPLINAIFVEAIKADILSGDILMDLLAKESWLGSEFAKRQPNNTVLRYKWIDLLAPSINHFFGEVKPLFQGLQDKANMVLCIDSLVLKIEGMLRDICRFSGTSTCKKIRDRQGNFITIEKMLNGLLDEQFMKDLLSEDEIAFLKFVLVEKAGLYLRHNIAHSFMLTCDQYQVTHMHMLLLILLRLAKFKFRQETNSE